MATHGHGETRSRTPSAPVGETWYSIYNMKPEVLQQARLRICGRAKDKEDARQLLEACGLVPYLGGAPDLIVEKAKRVRKQMTPEQREARRIKAAETRRKNLAFYDR